MSESVQSNSEYPSERRSYPRQNVLFSSAELGANNGGTILNISEGGLALRSVSELSGDECVNIRFQFSRTQPWIETRGRVAWISPSVRTAGLQFVGLPDSARERIKNWIALLKDDQWAERILTGAGKSDTNPLIADQIANADVEPRFEVPSDWQALPPIDLTEASDPTLQSAATGDP